MESGCWNHKKITEQRCRLNNFSEVIDLLEKTSPVHTCKEAIFPFNRLPKLKEKADENRRFQKATEPPRGKIG